MSIFFRSRTNGIVNVKMVITEEKILSNIDKIEKLINPKSKKQIVKLDEDSYFKDLVESVKSYLIEYPKKTNFPTSVYNAAYGLVEYATNQFEENTKTVEDLIRKREKNIKLGNVLRDATKVVKAKAKSWKAIVKKLETKYSPEVAENLTIIGNSTDTESEEYKRALKAIDVTISNLESNLHIEIDMERIEDTSKALSYIGIEIAEALKYIPAPTAQGGTIGIDDGVGTGVGAGVTGGNGTGTKKVSKGTGKTQESGFDSPLSKLLTSKKDEISFEEELELETEEAEEIDEVEEDAGEEVGGEDGYDAEGGYEAEDDGTGYDVEGDDGETDYDEEDSEDYGIEDDGEEYIEDEEDYVDETEEDYEDDVEDEEDWEVEEVQQPAKKVSAKVAKATPVQATASKAQKVKKVTKPVSTVSENDFAEEEYVEETRFEKKPSLWQRIKNSKIVRTINYILKIRVVLDYPALPEGESNK